MVSRSAEFDDVLLERILAVVSTGDEIPTLTNKRPNRIVSINRSGIEVETLRSERLGSGPQLVPAWMTIEAWNHLSQHGVLSHSQLQKDLNVKRSAFVCALLAKFPDVIVRSTRPTVLEFISVAGR